VRHAYSLSLFLTPCHRCSTTIKLIFSKSSVTLDFHYYNDFDGSIIKKGVFFYAYFCSFWVRKLQCVN
jgi:hypothetical protein